ncbi:MAG: hypothetical protein K2O66_06955, partial [Bacteroidales bacterium]|nr:hypothetical protein [Bacteroidales bacterium]
LVVEKKAAGKKEQVSQAAVFVAKRKASRYQTEKNPKIGTCEEEAALGRVSEKVEEKVHAYWV